MRRSLDYFALVNGRYEFTTAQRKVLTKTRTLKVLRNIVRVELAGQPLSIAAVQLLVVETTRLWSAQ